jgi:hypothetical protein
VTTASDDARIGVFRGLLLSCSISSWTSLSSVVWAIVQLGRRATARGTTSALSLVMCLCGGDYSGGSRRLQGWCTGFVGTLPAALSSYLMQCAVLIGRITTYVIRTQSDARRPRTSKRRIASQAQSLVLYVSVFTTPSRFDRLSRLQKVNEQAHQMTECNTIRHEVAIPGCLWAIPYLSLPRPFDGS